MRLDPSPIPKGKPTAYSNRAYFSPDATVSISRHILFHQEQATCLRQGMHTSLTQHAHLDRRQAFVITDHLHRSNKAIGKGESQHPE